MQEKFNPFDDKYQQIDDLPEGERGRFKRVLDKNLNERGFVRGQAIDDQRKAADEYNTFINSLRYGNLADFYEKKRTLEISDDFLNREEIIEAAESGVLSGVRKGDVSIVSEIVKKFKVRDSIFTIPEISKYAKNLFTQHVKNDDFYSARRIYSLFKISPDILSSNEVRSRVVTEFSRRLADVRDEFQCKSALEFAEEFNIPLQEYDKEARRSFLSLVSKGEMEGAFVVKEAFSLPASFVDSEKVSREVRGSYPRGADIHTLEDLREKRQNGKMLVNALYDLSTFSYPEHVMPILAAQGSSAHRYLFAINRALATERAAECFVRIAKKYGTKAREILMEVVNKMPDDEALVEELPTIEEFYDKIGISSFALYKIYRRGKMSGDDKQATEIVGEIKHLQSNIYNGSITREDSKKEVFMAVAYHTFPPASGVTTEDYAQLFARRGDRQGDIPEALSTLQHERFTLDTGQFSLDTGTTLDLSEWEFLRGIVNERNDSKENSQSVDDLADTIVQIWEGGDYDRTGQKTTLYAAIYRLHILFGGGHLSTTYDFSRSGLAEYQEFICDRVKNDLIRKVLKIWSERNPEKAGEIKRTIMDRIKNSRSSNFGQLKNRLRAVAAKSGDEQKKAIESLNTFLSDFDLSYEEVKNMDNRRLENIIEATPIARGDNPPDDYRTEAFYNSDAFMAAHDVFTLKYNTDEAVYQKISNDLVSGADKRMRAELNKFKHGNFGTRGTHTFEFVISKKREHVFLGYNTGVCVAEDDRLWEDHTFMNCIIFDPETERACGGVHFLVRGGNLYLPGINPSLSMLEKYDSAAIFNAIISYARKVQSALGLEKILIPTDEGIHSNRNEIHKIIREKSFPVVSLTKEEQFSYDPHEYSFKDCFEV